MLNFSELLKKYQDSFIYVDERRKTREVLEQIVDIEEKPVAFLPEKRIGLLAENARNSIYFDGLKEVSVKLFFVVNNEKSEKYYQDPNFHQSETDPFLEDDRLYVFLDEKVGILETNSSLLFLDVLIFSGISHKSVEKRDCYFMDYISAFEHKNERKKYI